MPVHLENSERYPGSVGGNVVMNPQWSVGAVFWFSVFIQF